MRAITSAYDRVMQRVERVDGCLEYMGSRSRGGYGLVGPNKSDPSTTRIASRIVWEHHHGPIPAGLLVLHGCDNPPCVEMEHLRLGTHAENSRDIIERGRWRPAGHARPSGVPHREPLPPAPEYLDVVFFDSQTPLPIRSDEIGEWEEIHLALFGEIRFQVLAKFGAVSLVPDV